MPRASANVDPEPRPAAARNTSTPIWRRTRFAPWGSWNVIGPTRDRDTEEQADDERTAARTEGQLAATRQRKRHGAEREPGGDADRESDRVDLGQATLGVAEHAGDVADRLGRSDDPHPVTEREHHVVVRDEVVVAAPDPRHRHAVPADEIEVDEPLAREPAVRHEDPPEVERRAVEREMAVAALADVDAESLDLVGRADHHQRVAGHRQVVVDRDGHHAVVADPAEADLVTITQFAQRGQARRADRDGPVDEIGRLRVVVAAVRATSEGGADGRSAG